MSYKTYTLDRLSQLLQYQSMCQFGSTNVSRTWTFICSVYKLDIFYINGKLMLEKPNTDEHICIKGGLIRDLIGYSMVMVMGACIALNHPNR